MKYKKIAVIVLFTCTSLYCKRNTANTYVVKDISPFPYEYVVALNIYTILICNYRDINTIVVSSDNAADFINIGKRSILQNIRLYDGEHLDMQYKMNYKYCEQVIALSKNMLSKKPQSISPGDKIYVEYNFENNKYTFVCNIIRDNDLISYNCFQQ